MNINGVNTTSVGSSYTSSSSESTDTSAQTTDSAVQSNSSSNYKSADEVLDAMANANADLVPQKSSKTIKVSNYVTADQAERIANAANECIDTLFSYEDAAVSEMNLSTSAAQSVAVSSFNSEYLSD